MKRIFIEMIAEIQDLYLLKNLMRKYGILKDIMEMKDLFFEKKVDVVGSERIK